VRRTRARTRGNPSDQGWTATTPIWGRVFDSRLDASAVQFSHHPAISLPHMCWLAWQLIP